MEQILDIFLPAVVAVLAVLTFLCLVRALKGPEISDRVICINMIGTLVIIIIAVLTVYLDESWLADIAALYAMISFLAVVVLTKIYIGVYREKHSKEEKEQ